MSSKGALETAPASIEQPLRTHEVTRQPRQLRGWRTVRELTEELRFPSEDACRVWLRRQRIASVRRGRVILIDGLDVDAALRRSHVRQSVAPRSLASRP